jgi:hypothetical protein
MQKLIVAASFVLMVASAVRVSAQQCPTPAEVSFEFQVDQPAFYRGDSTVIPRPKRHGMAVKSSGGADELLVQFVVDTLGIPDMRSFRTLRSPSHVAADSVRAAVPSWRFTPAVRDGCKVPQFVQANVIH